MQSKLVQQFTNNLMMKESVKEFYSRYKKSAYALQIRFTVQYSSAVLYEEIVTKFL